MGDVDFNDDMRDRLRALRRRAGLTQAALSERLACSPKRVANVEGGRRRPSLELVASWATACGYRPELVFVLATEPQCSPLQERLRALADEPPTGRAADALVQQLDAWAKLAMPDEGDR